MVKWSPILHAVSAIAGIAGFLALIVYWVLGAEGTFLGLPKGHFFNDAVGLLLVSVAFGIGTLIHLKEEKK